MGGRTLPAIVLLSAVIPLAALFSITIGTAEIDIGSALRILLSGIGIGDAGDIAENLHTIILRLRLPRVILALSAGASLAAAGALLQAVFLNPMADPYVMGISSGAAFAVALAITLGSTLIFAQQLVALAGAFASVFLVLGVSTLTNRQGEGSGLLLAGIAISVMLSSAVSLLMYVNQEQAERILFWTFGSLSSAGWNRLVSVLPFQFAGLLLILFQWREADILSQGEETARSLGVVPSRARVRLLLSASFVTGITVSATGIIGFIGLMIPHAVRMIIGPAHRGLLPVSMLGGALFLVLADTLGRVIIAPAELPVGIITAITGAPYLLFILIRRRRRGTL